jgi:hypothetical protein
MTLLQKQIVTLITINIIFTIIFTLNIMLKYLPEWLFQTLLFIQFMLLSFWLVWLLLTLRKTRRN